MRKRELRELLMTTQDALVASRKELEDASRSAGYWKRVLVEIATNGGLLAATPEDAARVVASAVYRDMVGVARHSNSPGVGKA